MPIARALASPVESDSSEISRAIADKLFERTRHRICRSLEDEGQNALAQQLQRLPGPRLSSWRPEIGLASRHCALGNPSLGALQLMAISPPSPLAATFALKGMSHVLADGWLVPVHGNASLGWNDDQLNLASDCGTMQFSLVDQRLVPSGCPEESTWNVTTAEGAKPHYVIQTAMAGSSGVFPWPSSGALAKRHGQPKDVVDTPSHSQGLQRALGLLTKQSPRYMTWLEDVLDGFMMTTTPGTAVSSPDFPGLVALGAMDCDLDYVEVLIGQASQQHLFQCLLVSPLTEVGYEEIHYLPSRRTYVTTRRTLAAAHEHANVISVLRDLQGNATSGVEERIARRLLMLHSTCFPALRKSTRLTEAGATMREYAQQSAHS